MDARPVAHPPEWPVYGNAARERASRLILAGRTFDYGYGQELAAFESSFAGWHHRRHSLAVSSGTTALLAAFFALGFGAGDEVIVPDYTFFSTATPLLLLGATPVLADVSEPEGTIDPAEVEALISPHTVGIVITHLWGHPADMDALLAIAARHGIATVEDCSHAHGSTLSGEPVGSRSDIAIFSVGGHKAISGGMGGMLLTDSPDLYARACLMTNFKHRTDLTIGLSEYRPFLATGLGGNFRMSPVAAVLAHSHLEELSRRVAARGANMNRLIDAVSRQPGIQRVPVRDGCTMGAWYDGVIEVTSDCPYSRDELVGRLRQHGLDVRAPATLPLHTFPVFQGCAPTWSRQVAAAVTACRARNARSYPHAQCLYGRWIRLPVNFLWDDEGAIVAPYAEAFAQVLSQAR